MDDFINDEYELTNDEVVDILKGIIDDEHAIIHLDEVEVTANE